MVKHHMIVGLLAWRFSAFHIFWNRYKVSRSLECFYKSIEFGLPNLANIVGSPFIASPFRNSQNCGRFASPSFRLKIHPHQLHLQLNLNSLFMEVSLRPCEIRCLGRWGITVLQAHFKWLSSMFITESLLSPPIMEMQKMKRSVSSPQLTIPF